MKLRFDLLKHLTAEDILEGALLNQHRYQAEPTFAKTGKGYLRPRTPEDAAREEAFSIELTRRITERAQRSKSNGRKRKG